MARTGWGREYSTPKITVKHASWARGPGASLSLYKVYIFSTDARTFKPFPSPDVQLSGLKVFSLDPYIYTLIRLRRFLCVHEFDHVCGVGPHKKEGKYYMTPSKFYYSTYLTITF